MSIWLSSLSIDYIRFVRSHHGLGTSGAIAMIVRAGRGDRSLSRGYLPRDAGGNRMLADVDLAPDVEEVLTRPAPGMCFFPDPGETLDAIVQEQVCG